MSLPLTPEMLAAAYDFLRTTPPFRGWRLPHSDAIELSVGCQRDREAHYSRYLRTSDHIIVVSSTRVGHTNTLLAAIAHEMIHLHQATTKHETSGVMHNADFRKHARTVCRWHGWDAKSFV